MSAQGEQAIIDGIMTDGKAEAQKITAEISAWAEDRKKATMKLIADIERKAEQDALLASEQIEKQEHSALEIEKRRLGMALREKTTNHILLKIQQAIEAIPDDKNRYGALIKSWLIEALAGLDLEEAIVHVSRIERAIVDGRFLDDAASTVKKLTGKNIKLVLAEKDENKQGIFVTSSDGRLGFSNHVQTRLRRKEDRIRARIQKVLFDGSEADA